VVGLGAACATVGPVGGGGGPGDDAGPGDAGDALSDRVSPPIDAGSDAADATPRDTGANDGPPGSGFCANVTPRPSFCADFDEGKPLEADWTQLVVEPGGTAQLGTVAKSPPYAFNAVTSAIVDGQYLHVLLIEALSPTVTTASLAFDVRFTKGYAIGPNTHITFARVRFPPVGAGALYVVEVGIYGGQGQLVETTVPSGGQPQYVMHACPFPAAALWVRAGIDVKLSPSPRARVAYDGATQIDTAITPASPSGMVSGEVGLDVGGSLEPVNASFDNVTFTAG
jgi:hypothetical protein